MNRLGSIALALTLTTLGGCVTPLKQVLPPEAREVDGGRNVLTTVTQNEIIAGIQQSNLAGAAGGGLLFALIDTGVNNSRAKAAESAITPVRDALADYPFDEKAMAASESLGQQLPWLGMRKNELNKDPANARFSSAIDASPGPQLIAITYDYLLDGGFQVLKVGANLTIAPKALPKNGKPEQRALLTNADFTRAFVCIFPLEGKASPELAENANRWATDGGKQTEEKLDRALKKLVVLMQKGLEFTSAQSETLKGAKNQVVQGFAGKVIETDAEGTLLLSPTGQWQYVFNAAPAAVVGESS